jgi:tetratricopeptide (TPR) repeat protein
MNITNENYLVTLNKVLDDIDTKPHNKVLPVLELLNDFDRKDIVVLKALTHIHFRNKDYAKALHYVLNALDIDPEDVQALKYKAWLYDETGDKQLYVRTLEYLIALGNADFEIYDQYAEYQENEGFILNALGSYTMALGSDENFHQAIHAAIGGANCYSKMGAYGIANEIYDTVLLVHPDDKIALYGKAYNYYLDNKINSAEKICKKLVSDHSDFQHPKDLLDLINKQKEKK